MYRSKQTWDMAVFLLDCREDEDKPSKVASQSVIEMAASFTDDTTLMEI